MSKTKLGQPIYYAVYVKEQIPSHWSVWFEGFTIVDLEEGGSILSGPIIDQSALHGLLIKVRDLNLTLISVAQMEPIQSKSGPSDSE